MGNKEYLQMAYEVARFHHEKWNGKGYPDGLKEDKIPLSQISGYVLFIPCSSIFIKYLPYFYILYYKV